MSYEVKYEGTEAEKDEKALADMRDYLGEDRYNAIVASVEGDESVKSMKQLRFIFGIMAGIEGYPVEAFARAHMPHLISTENHND